MGEQVIGIYHSALTCRRRLLVIYSKGSVFCLSTPPVSLGHQAVCPPSEYVFPCSDFRSDKWLSCNLAKACAHLVWIQTVRTDDTQIAKPKGRHPLSDDSDTCT